MDDTTRTALGRLADPAKTHRQLSADAVKARNEAIWQAHCQGAKLRELHDATGLAISTLHKIVVRQAEAHQTVHVGEGT